MHKIPDTTSMITALIFPLELCIAYVISRSLSQKIFSFFYLVTTSKSFAFNIVTIILFPGTVIHELSHLFTAEILGVRTGKLNLIPEPVRFESLKPNEAKTVTTGSVMVAETDPIRRAFIGLAPMISGIVLLTALSFYLPLWMQSAIGDILTGSVFTVIVGRCLLALYVMFTVSNSMYASRADMKGVLPLGIFLVVIVLTAYLAGLRFMPPKILQEGFSALMMTLAKSLGFVLGFNVVLLLLAYIGTYIAERVLRRRIR